MSIHGGIRAHEKIFAVDGFFDGRCIWRLWSDALRAQWNTVIRLKANGSAAQAAVEESFARIAELERNISSDMLKIEEASGTGEQVKISPEVYEILEIAQKYSELTGGAFDVTCGAAVELWGIDTKNPRVPTNDELAAVKNFVGYKHLHLHDGTAYLDLRSVKLNLGGIAKGYGVDLVRKIFVAHEIHDGLIDNLCFGQ